MDSITRAREGHADRCLTRIPRITRLEYQRHVCGIPIDSQERGAFLEIRIRHFHFIFSLTGLGEWTCIIACQISGENHAFPPKSKPVMTRETFSPLPRKPRLHSIDLFLLVWGLFIWSCSSSFRDFRVGRTRAYHGPVKRRCIALKALASSPKQADPRRGSFWRLLIGHRGGQASVGWRGKRVRGGQGEGKGRARITE